MSEGGYAPEAGAGLRRLLETVSDPKITAEAGAPDPRRAAQRRHGPAG